MKEIDELDGVITMSILMSERTIKKKTESIPVVTNA